MGEVAEQVGKFVSAYSSDLRDESLDGQRVVIGGIVTGIRTVVTKAKASMAIVTMEDLQGTVEVVVFPRLYEQTGPTWREGEILLVAGRVDHKGEEISLLADLVAAWDEAAAGGADAFARQVAATDRGSSRRGGGPNGGSNGAAGHGNGQRLVAPAPPPRPLVAVGPGQGAAAIPYVSPRRPGTEGDTPLPPIAPAEPLSAYPTMSGAAVGPDQDDEPSVPDEARARIMAAATADGPIDAGPETILHVRFTGSAPSDRVVGAMEAFKAVLRDRPGATRVIIHVPVPGGGAALPMELRRRVAYDAELLAEVRRRLPDGSIELRLA